jgi:uncharacterized membrane protein
MTILLCVDLPIASVADSVLGLMDQLLIVGIDKVHDHIVPRLNKRAESHSRCGEHYWENNKYDAGASTSSM